MKILKKIFAFGDSVMRGVVFSNQQPVVGGQQVAGRSRSAAGCGSVVKYKVSDENFVDTCAKRLGVTIENRSRFGSTILNGMDCIERYFNRIDNGDIVVLEFGGNDCNFDWKAIASDPDGEHQPKLTLQQFVANYNKVIDMVEDRGAVPVLLSLPELDSQRFFNHVSQGLDSENILRWLEGDVNNIAHWHEQYNLEVFKLGISRGVKVIDISSTFLQQRRLSEFICEDGMHPNEAGHRLIAEAILKEVA